MKKNLFLFFATVMLLTGCQQKGYVINGETSDKSLDSVRVIMKERIDRVWHNLDSTMIVNGKFELKGNVDSVRVVNLFFENKNPEKNMIEPIVLENGKINVKLDTANITVTGTKQNDEFNDYKQQMKSVYDKTTVLFDRIKDLDNSAKSNEIRDSVRKEIGDMEKGMTMKDVDFSMKNVNTLLGNYVFMNSFWGFTMEQKDSLFAKMNAKTKGIPRIAKLIEANEIEKKTSVGHPYVDIAMQDVNGKPVKLSNFVGKTDYLLLDFWASWCGPCRQAAPELVAFYTKNKGLKFDIVGISLDKEKSAWTKAIADLKLNWHHLSDLKFWESDGAKSYAVNAIPATVLIDKNGNIVGRNMDLKDIQKLLDQSSGKK